MRARLLRMAAVLAFAACRPFGADSTAGEEPARTPGPTPSDAATLPDGAPVPVPVDPAVDRFVFVTSATFVGSTLTTLQIADSKCKLAADAAKVDALKGKEWLAWISLQGSEPKTRIGTGGSGRFVRADGRQIARSWRELSERDLEDIILDEHGEVTGGLVWTFTDKDGSRDSKDCVSDPSAQGGLAQSKTTTWTDNGDQTCDTPGHVYCFQRLP